MALPAAEAGPLPRPGAMRGLARLTIAFAVVGLAAVAAWVGARRWAADPDRAWLADESSAAWIVADEPLRLRRRRLGVFTTSFRKSVIVAQAPARAELEVKAFRRCEVFVDGRPAAALEAPATWKVTVRKDPLGKAALRFDLAPFLAPGEHEIELRVANDNAPPAVLAKCPELNLATGAGWNALRSSGVWAPASLASAERLPELSASFPSSVEGLAATSPILALAFAAAAGAAVFATRRPRSLAGRFPPAASAVRWTLLWAWALLAANNVLRVPAHVGFDAAQHFDYVRYVAVRGTIPLPSEGWQMFQSPLYYLLSAPLLLVLEWIFEPLTALKLLRILPLACAAAQVEVCFRAARRVFPRRAGLQAAATLVGGLLPMNLYASQGLGNEPLAALLAGLLFVKLLDFFPAREAGPSRHDVSLAGGLLGLGLLAKATALLWAPISAAVVIWACRRARRPAIAAATRCALLFGVASLTGGWYYARNWIAIGQPFVGGWDRAREIVWWQDPGFRTPGDFLRFGTSIVHPVYATTAGFWDALHSTLWADGYLSGMIDYASRPPWNYSLLAAGAALALLPLGAIAAGAAAPLVRPEQDRAGALALATAAVGIHVAAIAALFAALPIYSTGKASYLAGTTPCLAILAAGGFDLIARSPAVRRLGRARTRWLVRPVVAGALGAWAAAAYGAFFVLGAS